MLGFIDPQQSQVTVVGGGIAGLLAAYFLDKKGYEVSIFEAHSRVGGLIRTDATEWGPVEWAAHSLLSTEAVTELCSDLGVELLECRQRARYILRNRKLKRYPLTFLETLEALWRICFTRANIQSPRIDQNMKDWAKKHVGSAALQYLVSPMIQGIYGSKANEISQSAAFPGLDIPQGQTLFSAQVKARLFNRQIEKKGPLKMVTPLLGMGSLVHVLEQRLQKRLEGRYHLNHSVKVLPQHGNVVIATSAPVAAQLLKDQDPLLSQQLEQVRYTPLLSVTIFIKRDLFKQVPQGVGVLIPDGEKNTSLGVLFNSSSFEVRVQDPQNWMSLTMILGGSREPEILDRLDSEIEGRVRNELSLLFGISEDFLKESSLKCFIKRTQQAVPVYDKHLANAWRNLELGWCSEPGHVIFGNYTGQVSIRGMIESASLL